ncbi:MAG TPA: hypothetical protein VN667_20465 [Burkholderiales bacterium]|nr:hypothetical protein [Burkholderiales bacterium]
MTDHEFMRLVFKGNQDAINLIDNVRVISHVWDDVVDGNPRLTREQVSDAFMLALVTLPDNPFYVQHRAALRGVMTVGALNWKIANQFERGNAEERVLAHVLRYSIADICVLIAHLIGGPDWAEQHGPELRRRSQKDTLKNYLSELEERDGTKPAP